MVWMGESKRNSRLGKLPEPSTRVANGQARESRFVCRRCNGRIEIDRVYFVSTRWGVDFGGNLGL